MIARRALVQLDGRKVGFIEESGDRTRFHYDPEWLANREAVPISLTLPLSDHAYETKGLHPFFENLLPEGWLLEISTAYLKLSKDDAFGLLCALCRDCAGAVEIVPLEPSQGTPR